MRREKKRKHRIESKDSPLLPPEGNSVWKMEAGPGAGKSKQQLWGPAAETRCEGQPGRWNMAAVALQVSGVGGQVQWDTWDQIQDKTPVSQSLWMEPWRMFPCMPGRKDAAFVSAH